MNQQLKKLITLQEIDTKLKSLDLEKDKIPKVVSQKEQEIQRLKDRLQKEKENLVKAEKDRKDKEHQVEDNEQKVIKYQQQLYQVKTNKEYFALREEIEFLKEKNKSIEDEIIAIMEHNELKKLELTEKEKQISQAIKEFEHLNAEKQKEQQQIQSKIETLAKQRSELEKQVDRSLIDIYNTISRRQDGIAVSKAVDGICMGCHLELRLQDWAALLKGEQIIQCWNCHRILYVDPEFINSSKNLDDLDEQGEEELE